MVLYVMKQVCGFTCHEAGIRFYTSISRCMVVYVMKQVCVSNCREVGVRLYLSRSS